MPPSELLQPQPVPAPRWCWACGSPLLPMEKFEEVTAQQQANGTIVRFGEWVADGYWCKVCRASVSDGSTKPRGQR